MLCAETICVAILVSGRIVATISTIWNLACRLVWIAFWPGDHHHRHRAEIGIGGAGGEIERAGPERGQADPGAAGQPAIGRRHESGGLLVTGDARA